MEDPVLIYAQWLGTPEAALLAARPLSGPGRMEGCEKQEFLSVHVCP